MKTLFKSSRLGRPISIIASGLFLLATSTFTPAAATTTIDFPFPFPGWGPKPVTAATEALPSLNLDPNRVTVSGVSSGGFMAVQLHVAHSALFHGAASVAGGIYECSKGELSRSQGTCMHNPQSIVTKDHIDLAHERAKSGQIDDLSNLKDDRVAIFASPKDTVIKAVGSDKLEEFYEAFLPKTSISRLTHPQAAHGFPTLNYGSECTATGTPWILNCQEDLAGKLLAATEPANRPLAARGTQDLKNLIYFDQSKLVSSRARMYAWGALYVPQVCREPGASCGVHVALHGCQMNPDFIQKQFIENAGYNEWAESNRLVVVYPQSAKSVGNPYACWDWFGITGAEYTQKSGPQIEGIRAILSALGLP